MADAAFVRCVDCERFSLHRAGALMAGLGFGCCAMRPVWWFRGASLEHDCEHHMKAEPTKVLSRARWLDAKKGRSSSGS